MSRLVTPKHLLLGAALLMSACASVVGVDESQWIEAENQTIPTDWSLPVETVRADSFAALYDDPVLASFLSVAVADNYDLQQARLRIERAEAQLLQALSRPQIQLDSSAGASVSSILDDVDDISDSGNLGLTASLDPDIFGRLSAGIEGAETRALIARAEEARLRRTILANVVSAYTRSIETALLLSVAEQNLDFLSETERVTRARFEGGDAAGSDLALARLELQTARASLAEQRFAAEDSRRALSILVGGFGDARLEGFSTLPDTLPDVSGAVVGLAENPIQTLDNRYDVQSARLAVTEATANLEGVIASDLPGFSLRASLSNNADLEDLFDVDSYIASLVGSLAFNLLDGGLNDAQQAEARTNIDLAVSNYAETLRRASQELRTALSQADALEEALNALREAERSAERALELESIRFDLGEAILLDVLTVQRRVDATRSARIRTQRRYLESIAQAHLALGPSET
ncbi:MAG: TolC family protein [Pseudomonadota bacterium]